LSSNIFFEFIAGKYCSGNAVPSSAGVANVTCPGTGMPGWLLPGACLQFMTYTAAGVFILLLPASEPAQLLSNALGTSHSGTGEPGVSGLKDYRNAIASASQAVASPFLCSPRLCFGLLATCSPLASVVLWAFAHTLLTLMLAVMIWRIAPNIGP
jgi:hypothetical protein